MLVATIMKAQYLRRIPLLIAPTHRAPDIVDLENKLNNAEGDVVLSSRAIEICERLQEEINEATQRARYMRIATLEEERLDFERVLALIEVRRHVHALDQYRAHTRAKGDPLGNKS